MSRKITVSGKGEAVETFIYNARGLHFRVFFSYNGGAIVAWNWLHEYQAIVTGQYGWKSCWLYLIVK